MPDVPAYYLFATQHPTAVQAESARHRPKPDFTGIVLILIRLAEKKTDILVSINVPHAKGEYREEEIDLASQKVGPLLEKADAIRQKILESFEVKDWGLFLQEDE
jgi:hypothetical protein